METAKRDQRRLGMGSRRFKEGGGGPGGPHPLGLRVACPPRGVEGWGWAAPALYGGGILGAVYAVELVHLGGGAAGVKGGRGEGGAGGARESAAMSRSKGRRASLLG